MSLQIYILTKLMEGDSYPYELKKALSDPIPFAEMANLTESKLYYHFDALTKRGFIQEVKVIQEENRPDKHIFGITDAGRAALPEMIYKTVEKALTPIEIVVCIGAMQYVDKERIAYMLERKVEKTKKRQDDLGAIYEQIETDDATRQYLSVFQQFMSNTMHLHEETYEQLIEKLKA